MNDEQEPREKINLDDPTLEFPQEEIELKGDEEQYPVKTPILDDFIHKQGNPKMPFDQKKFLKKQIRSVIRNHLFRFNTQCTMWDVNHQGMMIRNIHNQSQRRITKYDLD